MKKLPFNYLKSLINIRRGSYKLGTKGHKTLMHFRKTDPYKLASSDKVISYNIKTDIFKVK